MFLMCVLCVHVKFVQNVFDFLCVLSVVGQRQDSGLNHLQHRDFQSGLKTVGGKWWKANIYQCFWNVLLD